MTSDALMSRLAWADELDCGQDSRDGKFGGKKGSVQIISICSALSGEETCCIEVGPQMSVAEVKSAIMQKTGLAKHTQRLLFQSGILHNKQVLGNAALELFGNCPMELFLVRRGSDEQLKALQALAQAKPRACAELFQLAVRSGLHDLPLDLPHLAVLRRPLFLGTGFDERDRCLFPSQLETWLQEDDEFLRMMVEIDYEMERSDFLREADPQRRQIQIGHSGWSHIVHLALIIARSKIQANEKLARGLMLECDEPLFLASLLPDLMRNPSFVELTVQRDGLALRFASPEVRADARIVRLAIDQNGMALKHAAPALQADPGIVLKAVGMDGMALRHAAPPLRASHRIVERAVETDPMALQFAHLTFRANRKIVAQALSRKGAALQFASIEQRSNRFLVLLAVSQDGDAFKFASDTLRADLPMVQDAIAICHKAFSHAVPGLQAKKLVRLSAAKTLLALPQHALDLQDPQGEQSITSQIEARIGKVVASAPKPLLEALLQIQPVAVAAIRDRISNWEKLDPEMRADPQVALAGVEKNWRCFLNLPYGVRRDFKVMVAAALQDEAAYSFMLKTDMWMVKSAVAMQLKAAPQGHASDQQESRLEHEVA